MTFGPNNICCKLKLLKEETQQPIKMQHCLVEIGDTLCQSYREVTVVEFKNGI